MKILGVLLGKKNSISGLVEAMLPLFVMGTLKLIAFPMSALHCVDHFLEYFT